jgi:hypothetical protein
MIRYTERVERLSGSGRAVKVGALVVLAAVLFGVATPAFGQLTSTLGVEPHWKTNVKPDAAGVLAGRLPFEDYVMIEDTQVTSFELNRLGFGSFTPTISTGAAGAINFSVTLKSSGPQGNVTITGVIVASTMTGTATWVKDGKTYNYSFTGVPYTPAVDPES